MLTSLGEAKYFTTLDLKSGYWQIPLDDQDKEKTAFCCQGGLYEYNVMPSALANAPGIFKQLMSIVLCNCESFALVYLDDIIIFSSNLEDHEKHIQQVILDRII